MTILRCLQILKDISKPSVARNSDLTYRLSQVQFLYDDTWPQIEVVSDDLDKLLRGLIGSPIGLDKEGEGFRHAWRVSALDELRCMNYSPNGVTPRRLVLA